MESDFHILIEESDANLIDRKPLPGFEINYDSNYSVRQTSNSFGYGSKYMTQPFERLNRVSSTSDIIFPSVLAVDADYDLRQEIQAVQENISTMVNFFIRPVNRGQINDLFIDEYPIFRVSM